MWSRSATKPNVKPVHPIHQVFLAHNKQSITDTKDHEYEMVEDTTTPLQANVGEPFDKKVHPIQIHDKSLLVTTNNGDITFWCHSISKKCPNHGPTCSVTTTSDIKGRDVCRFHHTALDLNNPKAPHHVTHVEKLCKDGHPTIIVTLEDFDSKHSHVFPQPENLPQMADIDVIKRWIHLLPKSTSIHIKELNGDYERIVTLPRYNPPTWIVSLNYSDGSSHLGVYPTFNPTYLTDDQIIDQYLPEGRRPTSITIRSASSTYKRVIKLAPENSTDDVTVANESSSSTPTVDLNPVKPLSRDDAVTAEPMFVEIKCPPPSHGPFNVTGDLAIGVPPIASSDSKNNVYTTDLHAAFRMDGASFADYITKNYDFIARTASIRGHLHIFRALHEHKCIDLAFMRVMLIGSESNVGSVILDYIIHEHHNAGEIDLLLLHAVKTHSWVVQVLATHTLSPDELTWSRAFILAKMRKLLKPYKFILMSGKVPYEASSEFYFCYKHMQWDTLDYILERTPESPDVRFLNNLHALCKSSVSSGQLDVLKMLLKHKVVNRFCVFRMLTAAVDLHQMDILDFVIRHCYQNDVCVEWGPLHLAYTDGRLDLFTHILDHELCPPLAKCDEVFEQAVKEKKREFINALIQKDKVSLACILKFTSNPVAWNLIIQYSTKA